ncbi:single-stranded DNA-binding protein [Streptomyces sp. NPDC058067]|uniref:single-stranded DNA-binding protein n=1 Tax=Streptomyces sp. NPDC058067 TaxID=3346324 RepID=UPI0036E9D287
MSETTVTVVGNVATTPVYRELPKGPVARFRLAATSRHFDRVRNEWVDGHTNFFTVWAWGALGTNVQGSLSIGEPVLVQGRLRVRDEERGGQHWTSADIQASAVGHDLSRGTTAFRRSRQERAVRQQDGDAPSFEIEPEKASGSRTESGSQAGNGSRTENGSPGGGEPRDGSERREPAAVG